MVVYDDAEVRGERVDACGAETGGGGRDEGDFGGHG